MTMQKWGGLASFLLAATFFAPLIYLLGGLRDAIGVSAYDLADFLYGPVWGASLITVVFVLRERIGEDAPRRMTLALLAAFLAAGAMVSVAFIRSANRQYLATHPELDENMLLVAWTTIVSGVIAMGRHCLGWSLVLLGLAGWASRSLPRGLSILYMVAGMLGLFGYLLPEDANQTVVPLAVVVSIWQGILLWKAKPGEPQAPETTSW